MNFDKKGDTIAIILDEKNKIIQDPHAVLSVKQELGAMQEFKCRDNEHLQHVPSRSKARWILYITGQSGSGKSYYTLQYCRIYKKMFPNNSIYLFSALEEDETLDKLPGLKRIKFSDAFLLTPFNINDFANSLVIFDDYDTFQNKKLYEKVEGILNMILMTGRHTKTSCIIIRHTSTDKQRTKIILNECNSVTVFPLSTSPLSLHYLMHNYFGLTKQQIEKLKNLHSKSRWVTVHKTYPPVVMYEKGAYVLNYITDK
jgi:hypothetical protein